MGGGPSVAVRAVSLALLLACTAVKPAATQADDPAGLGDLDSEGLDDPYEEDPYGSDIGDDEEYDTIDLPSAHLTGFVDLDDKTLDKVLPPAKHSMHAFLELFADWCGACKELKPELQAVGDEFSDHSNLLLAKADANSNPAIAARFNVTAYPTIKYRRCNRSEWEDYDGERDSASIIQLLGDIAGDPGTVDAMQPHAKAFREASSRDSVKSSAQETLSSLDDVDAGNAQYYIKVMEKAMSKGDDHFTNEYKRLKRLVDAGDMRPDKQSEFKRRMGILKQFMTDNEKSQARSKL